MSPFILYIILFFLAEIVGCLQTKQRPKIHEQFCQSLWSKVATNNWMSLCTKLDPTRT